MTVLQSLLNHIYRHWCQHPWCMKSMQPQNMILRKKQSLITVRTTRSRCCQLQDSLLAAKPRIRRTTMTVAVNVHDHGTHFLLPKDDGNNRYNSTVPSVWMSISCRRWYGLKTTRVDDGHKNQNQDSQPPPPPPPASHSPTAYTRFQLASLQEQIHRMRELMDETRYPVGSFKEKQFIHARVAFKLLKRTSTLFLEMEDAAQTMNLIFDVLERLAKEFPYHDEPKPVLSPTHTMDDEEDEDDEDHEHHQTRRNRTTLSFQHQWLLGRTQVPHYVHIWKKMALEGHPVYRAQELLVKIQSMAKHYPDFEHNIKVYGVIMGVLMKQEDPQIVPDWAEKIYKYVQENEKNGFLPDVFLFNQVIQSWAAASERVEAAGKISDWYARMRQNFISGSRNPVRPDIVTYSILHRFWGKKVDTYQLDCLFRDMRLANIAPDIICLNGAIYGYASAGEIDTAQDLLRQMITLRPENRSQMRMISEGAQKILLACRDEIENRSNDDLANMNAEQDNVIGQAEAVFQLVADKVDHRAREGLFCTLVDVYIRGENNEKFESVRHELNPSNKIHLALLMKYYVRRGQIEKAISILRERLRVDRTKLDLEMFHILINELSKSTISTAFDQARRVLELIDESANIEADNSTYLCLFKCLSNSKENDAGKIALEMLIEMDRRSRAGSKPFNADDILAAFTMALNIALDSGEIDSAEKLLDWMKQSKNMVTTRVYNVVLRSIARRCSVAAARKAEELLDSMKNQKSRTMQPDVESYTAVIEAWAGSGANYAGKRVLLTYERMLLDKVNPNLFTYSALIESLSASRLPEMLQKAESILHNLEDSLLPSVQPNSKHYSSIMKGWISIGDALSAERLMARQISFHITKQNRRSRPIPAHYFAIVKAYTTTGDLAGATSFINKIQVLKDEGILPLGPSLETYEYLKDVWFASNEPDRYDQVSRIEAILRERYLLMEKNPQKELFVDMQK